MSTRSIPDRSYGALARRGISNPEFLGYSENLALAAETILAGARRLASAMRRSPGTRQQSALNAIASVCGFADWRVMDRRLAELGSTPAWGAGALLDFERAFPLLVRLAGQEPLRAGAREALEAFAAALSQRTGMEFAVLLDHVAHALGAPDWKCLRERGGPTCRPPLYQVQVNQVDGAPVGVLVESSTAAELRAQTEEWFDGRRGASADQVESGLSTLRARLREQPDFIYGLSVDAVSRDRQGDVTCLEAYSQAAQVATRLIEESGAKFLWQWSQTNQQFLELLSSYMDALVRYRRDVAMALDVGKQLRRWSPDRDDFGLRFRLPALATVVNKDAGELPPDVAHDFATYVEQWDAPAMLFSALPLLRSPLESGYEQGVELVLEAAFLMPGLGQMILEGTSKARRGRRPSQVEDIRVTRAWTLLAQERPETVESAQTILMSDPVIRVAAKLLAKMPPQEAGYADLSSWHQEVRSCARELARALTLKQSGSKEGTEVSKQRAMRRLSARLPGSAVRRGGTVALDSPSPRARVHAHRAQSDARRTR
jgi:hypothetical protein